EVRGWEEPAHLRAVLRRPLGGRGGPATGNERAGGITTAPPPAPQPELARGGGGPGRGPPRGAAGPRLGGGAGAPAPPPPGPGARGARGAEAALPAEEALGLECLLLLYGRPAVLLGPALLGIPPLWNLLEDQREILEQVCPAVGRIELLGHPDHDWAGTGFL